MLRFRMFVFGILLTLTARAQDNWSMRGYVKGMSAMQTIGDNGEISLENLVHNRLDINWFINDKFTFTAGLRNRIIIGNNVSLIPGYSDYVARDLGYVDLTWRWADENSWIGISQLDRLMIDYTAGRLQITLGRQRINWGQTFVWNPNDLFNSYSYFDFDYEERPGSDALRLQYYIGESSKLELSTSLNSESQVTSVFLYRFNTRGFDIQFLGGVYTETDLVMGGGFSGSVGGGGFSGELTFYHALEDRETENRVTATIHYDYTFRNSLNLQFEALYNGFGTDNFTSGIGDLIFQDLSPKNLFPTKVTFFVSGAYDVSPLFRVMLANMYGPNGNFVYIGPTLTYSMSNTLELSGIMQYFNMDEADDLNGNPLANSGTAMFFRLKWSF